MYYDFILKVKRERGALHKYLAPDARPTNQFKLVDVDSFSLAPRGAKFYS